MGQVIGWEQLIDQGFHIEGNISSSFFYILTWAHATHAIAGLIALVYVAVQAFRFQTGSGKTDRRDRQRGVLALPGRIVAGADGAFPGMVLGVYNSLTEKLSGAEKNMLMFLSADAIMTLTVFAAFAYLRFNAPQWPAAFHFGSGLMAAAMTMFLLSGSFTMFLAVRATHGGEADADAPARWIAVTIATWCCFLLLEGVEWVRLILIMGVTMKSNPWNVPLFGATYFILTGFTLCT